MSASLSCLFCCCCYSPREEEEGRGWVSYQADSLSLEEWAGARCKAVSALGSLTDCAHPESQLQDGGGPSDGAQLLNLNERLSPRALQSYFPECCPLLSVLMLDKATEPAEEELLCIDPDSRGYNMPNCPDSSFPAPSGPN